MAEFPARLSVKITADMDLALYSLSYGEGAGKSEFVRYLLTLGIREYKRIRREAHARQLEERDRARLNSIPADSKVMPNQFEGDSPL